MSASAFPYATFVREKANFPAKFCNFFDLYFLLNSTPDADTKKVTEVWYRCLCGVGNLRTWYSPLWLDYRSGELDERKQGALKSTKTKRRVKIWRVKTRRGKTQRDNFRRGKTRRVKARRDNSRWDNSRRGKTRLANPRQAKPRLDETRLDESRPEDRARWRLVHFY